MTEHLFDPGPTVGVEPTASATVKLTARRREALANGRHPLRMDPLREPAGETCGSCRHLDAQGHSRTYYKCGLRPYEITHGPATDIRRSWPACVRWEAA